MMMKPKKIRERDWGRTKKPTGRFHEKAGVQTSTFIRDHLIRMGGDHIYSTYGAYKKMVRKKERELGFKKGHYRVGSYMTMKYYFYLLKTLGLIKPTEEEREGKVDVLIAKPVVYKVVNTVSSAWERPRETLYPTKR